MFSLIDNAGNDINIGDIIKNENLRTKKVVYYLCGESMLYKYDGRCIFSHDSLGNIKLDDSVTFANNEIHMWTRIGKESEVFDEIFKRGK
jgi:hypothetical protein